METDLMPENPVHPRIRNLDALARIMDSQFRIPGSQIRFGMDSIIGLIPGVGDLISFFISAYIMSTASKLGASNYVMARMALNSGIDAIIGSIPLLGDIFDVGFKAIKRNIKLLQRHYKEGKHQGSAAKVFIPLAILLLALLAGFFWLSYKLLQWLF
jgi:hypothetical protein